MKTMPDSNVIFDVIVQDPVWGAWSSHMMSEYRRQDALVINPIVYAETAGRFDRVEGLDSMFRNLAVEKEDLPWLAAYKAGRAHVIYRKAGGARTRVLPDFLIAAHASVRGYRILTRDGARYRSYFPDIEVISPDSHP